MDGKSLLAVGPEPALALNECVVELSSFNRASLSSGTNSRTKVLSSNIK